MEKAPHLHPLRPLPRSWCAPWSSSTHPALRISPWWTRSGVAFSQTPVSASWGQRTSGSWPAQPPPASWAVISVTGTCGSVASALKRSPRGSCCRCTFVHRIQTGKTVKLLSVTVSLPVSNRFNTADRWSHKVSRNLSSGLKSSHDMENQLQLVSNYNQALAFGLRKKQSLKLYFFVPWSSACLCMTLAKVIFWVFFVFISHSSILQCREMLKNSRKPLIFKPTNPAVLKLNVEGFCQSSSLTHFKGGMEICCLLMLQCLAEGST